MEFVRFSQVITIWSSRVEIHWFFWRNELAWMRYPTWQFWDKVSSGSLERLLVVHRHFHQASRKLHKLLCSLDTAQSDECAKWIALLLLNSGTVTSWYWTLLSLHSLQHRTGDLQRFLQVLSLLSCPRGMSNGITRQQLLSSLHSLVNDFWTWSFNGSGHWRELALLILLYKKIMFQSEVLTLLRLNLTRIS